MKRTLPISLMTILTAGLLASFTNNGLKINSKDGYVFHKTLSEYELFDGNLSELSPSVGVEIFELSTTLHADYAEKQRLIKLPVGTSMKPNGNGLPDFPDGTILVKTFYYHKDDRDPGLGKTILETRLLVKDQSKWYVGTYQWNKAQTEATFIGKGAELMTNWIDDKGKKQTVYFPIPSQKDCSTCHEISKTDMPLGPKLRNLNFEVQRNGKTVNQLEHFKGIGWLDAAADVRSMAKLPNWQDESIPLENRARAYLDINCASCHNELGSAANNKLFLSYETPYDDSGIETKKKNLDKRMELDHETMRMPNLGVTLKHKEGIELVKLYVNGL